MLKNVKVNKLQIPYDAFINITCITSYFIYKLILTHTKQKLQIYQQTIEIDWSITHVNRQENLAMDCNRSVLH